jgi:hypothetical protein
LKTANDVVARLFLGLRLRSLRAFAPLDLSGDILLW